MAESSSGYVLVVDDVQFMRRQIVRILENLGYEAVDASGGAHAIQTMQLNPPMLVILDLNMPQVNGFDVCEWMRCREATKHIPIVVCTASQDRKTLEKAIRAGASDILIKPVNKENIQVRLDRHLRTVRQ